MSREFDDALNDCLGRLTAGESIKDCVARYPEHKRELIPLLGVAAKTIDLARSTSYRPEAKLDGPARLNEAAPTMRASRRRFVPRFLSRPLTRPVAIGLAAALLMIVTAGGTTLASSNSVPGDPLYWVKTTRETVSLRLHRSDMGKAQGHAHLAGVRGQEMRRLVASGRFDDAELLVRRLQHHLRQSAQYAGFRPPAGGVALSQKPFGPTRVRGVHNLTSRLERNSTALRATMFDLLRRVPQEQRPRVRRIIEQSDTGYDIVIQVLESGYSPRMLPFFILEPLDERGADGR